MGKDTKKWPLALSGLLGGKKKKKKTTVRGNLDVVNALEVYGWAEDKSRSGHRLTVDLYVDGMLAAHCRADQYRQDLEEFGIGDGRHSFLYTFAKPLSVGPHSIVAKVAAHDFELPGSGERTIAYPSEEPAAGHIENITAKQISGWAIRFSDPNQPVEIVVTLAGKELAKGLAGIFRADLQNKYGGNGFFGFVIPLPNQLTRKDYPKLAVALAGTGISLPLPALGATAFPESLSAASRFDGHLDKCNRNEISGWAVDRSVYPAPATLCVSINGIPVSKVQANQIRTDLRQRFPEANGRIGFSFNIQPTGATIQDAVLWMRSVDGSYDLHNTPARFFLGPPGVRFQPHRLYEIMRAHFASETLPIPAPRPDAPKIGIVVLNRNGADFLETLFSSFSQNNTWENYEFIIIDHISADNSKAVCAAWSEKLTIRFVPRRRNHSYSASNNYGASLTDAPLLFLLNNDIEFCQDILGGMAAFFQDPAIGMVGLRLDYAPHQFAEAEASLSGFGFSLERTQHLGIKFASDYWDRSFLPFEMCGTEPTVSVPALPRVVPGVTAAAMMLRREDFFAVGGFSERYFYGYEDVDLALAVTARLGKKVVCAGHLRAFHLRSASIQQVSEERTLQEGRGKNRLILNERVGGYLHHQFRRERLDDTVFYRSHPVRVALLVSEARDETACGDYFTAKELVAFMSREADWDFYFVPQEHWDDLQPFDVAIALVETFRIEKVQSANPHLILIAWVRNWFDRWLVNPFLGKYDQVWVSSEKARKAFAAKTDAPVRVIRIATNPESFRQGVFRPELASDYCFTGSYFGSDRQIATQLDPDSVPYTGAIFGSNWETFERFAALYRGPLPYARMPDVYASTHIVIDDANHTTLEWGSVNSRVFDALAAGKLVITNSREASNDLFDGALPVYTSQDELTALLNRYLGDPEARAALVRRLQDTVLGAHTYAQRAREACAAIREAFACLRATVHIPKPQDHFGSILDQFRRHLHGPDLFVDITDKTHISFGRSIGADIHFVFTEIDQVGQLPQQQSFQPRILVVLCSPLALSPRLVSHFDLALVPDERAADQVRRLGDIPVLPLTAACAVTDEIAGVERKLLLQTLFAEHFAPIVGELKTRLLAFLAERREVQASEPMAVAETEVEERSDLPKEALKLAYVLWDFPALSQTFVLNELRWLVQNGYDVNVYFMKEPDKAATLDYDIPSYHVEGVDELRNYLRLHGRNTVHGHFAYPATALLAYPAATAEGLSFTFMVHAVDICHQDNVTRNKLAEVTNSPLCLKVLTLGLCHRDILLAAGVPADKIVLERQASLPFPFRERTQRAQRSRPLVIAIGRFIEKKGYTYLVEAARLLPEVDFRLYGYGPLEDALREQAAGLANLAFPGVLGDTDAVARAYDEADLFAMPCVRAADGDMDGLPTVLLEAMSAGIPVVSTDVSNIGELIKDGFSGFMVTPRDAGDLAAAIRRALACDPVRLRHIVDTARETAQRFANIPKTMHTLTNIWQRTTLDIVLVTYNVNNPSGLELTSAIIERIYKYTTLNFRLIVVDNNSDPEFTTGLQQLFGKRENFVFIALPENILCGPATNIGAAAGQGKYILYVCSNEGFVLQYGWERDLVRFMDAHPETGIAGHVIHMPRYHDGKSYVTHPQFAEFRNPEFAREHPDRPFGHVQGGVYILRREAFERDGGFSDNVPHGGMDIEYSYYLESCGWTLGHIPGIASFTVKTRPTLTAVLDETIVAAHPLTLPEAARADALAAARVRACNLCGWTGPAFEDGRCPDCGATPFSRSVMKLCGSSGLVQQRPGLALVSDDDGLVRHIGPWCARARCHPVAAVQTPEALTALLEETETTLVVIDHRTWTPGTLTALQQAAGGFLARGGTLLVGENPLFGEPAERHAPGLTPESLAPALRAAGVPVRALPYRSFVLDLDWRAVFLSVPPTLPGGVADATTAA